MARLILEAGHYLLTLEVLLNLLMNMIENGYDRARVPLKDDFGDIHYLGKRYSILNVPITENDL